jgi:hypothetical protein
MTTYPAFLGALIAGAFLIAGCTNGPRYVNANQTNSARIVGFATPHQGSEDGSSTISIIAVDGFVANFTASHPGPNWPLHTPLLYLAPGAHTLTLRISEIEEVIGVNSGNSAGIVGATSSGNKPTITTEFLANHAYRFGAFLNGYSISLILWDETNGRATRPQAASWFLNSNSNYSDSPAPSGRHR